jgi:hypothetical protein
MWTKTICKYEYNLYGCLENRDYGRRDPPRWPRDTLLSTKVCQRDKILKWRSQSRLSLLGKVEAVEELAENCYGWALTIREPRRKEKSAVGSRYRIILMKIQQMKKTYCVPYLTVDGEGPWIVMLICTYEMCLLQSTKLSHWANHVI